MGHPLKLPALGALALAAAAFGLHLGQSAVSDINPVHYQGPALHPRDRGAALEDVPEAPLRSQFALAYGWEEGASARASECADCVPAAPTTYWPGPESQRPAPQSHAVAERLPAPPRPAVRRTADQPQPELREESFEVRHAAVERYAYYEIEEPKRGDRAAAPEAGVGYGD